MMFYNSSPLIISLLASLGHVQAVRFVGRVNPVTRELTWPGTGVAFTFTGSSASIGIEALTGANSVELKVDGQTIVISSMEGSSISTPAGLANGNHTVVLRKRSEASIGTIFVGNITTDGVFGPDVIPTRKIEYIGDSITVGYGLDGLLPCVNSAALENHPKTYAALTAESLGADYDSIAWSGIGITRNYVTTTVDTSPAMPQRWTHYGANDADNSYTFPADATPNAVVINLGTNDFSYIAYDASGQPFNARPTFQAADYTAATVKFVKTIQSHYPHAAYFLLTSPMLNDGYPSAEEAQKTTQTKALTAAVAQLSNGTNIQLVDWPSQGSDALGCDYHPNAATNAAEAEVLKNVIARELGW